GRAGDRGRACRPPGGGGRPGATREERAPGGRRTVALALHNGEGETRGDGYETAERRGGPDRPRAACPAAPSRGPAGRPRRRPGRLGRCAAERGGGGGPAPAGRSTRQADRGQHGPA